MLKMTPKEVNRLKSAGKIALTNKFGAKKVKLDGITFDSKAEGQKYMELSLDPDIVHVDVHVPVTFRGGIRFVIDFVAWKKTFCRVHNAKDGCCPAPEAIEVKGVSTEAFRVKRKLFDSCHPLRPLRVMRLKGNSWDEL